MVMAVKMLILQHTSSRVHNQVYKFSLKQAFTMIEMLVVLALMGILFSMMAPRFSRRSSSSDWSAILCELNNLVQFARQESIADQVTFRLVFYKGKQGAPDGVFVERMVRLADDGKKIFEQATSPYLKVTYEFAENVHLRKCYLGKEELLRESGQAFCYIMPEGLVQDLFVHVSRAEDDKDETVTLKMQPFYGRFELIEKAVRPGQE